MKTRCLMLIALIATACGAPPKTAEMISYEQMRQEEYAATVQERFPKLFKQSIKNYRKAKEAHEDGEPELALHYTRMATISYRTAQALSQKKDAEDSQRAAANRLKIANEQFAKASTRKKTAEDAIARIERIIEMQGQMAKLKADEKVKAVLAKIKKAESMGAAKYAPGELNKARASFQLAMDAAKAGKQKQADKHADAAMADATLAIAAAQPHWEKEQKERQIDARLRTAMQAATAVPNSETRLDGRGMVLTVRQLFKPGKTAVAPEKTFAVDQVAKMAKDFPEFGLLVEGHTDNRGSAKSNLVLSQGRAQAVMSHLISKGIDAKRLTALGKGEEEPIADNSSRDGRQQNRRVDVIFLRASAK